jgi:drug/metabolite transporter (DMT)-like permease
LATGQSGAVRVRRTTRNETAEVNWLLCRHFPAGSGEEEPGTGPSRETALNTFGPPAVVEVMADRTVVAHRGLQSDEAGGLLLLAAIWGASFLFIKVAVEEMEPIAVVAARVGLGAVGLSVALVARRGWRGVRALLEGIRWRDAMVLSITASAVPFFLIAWAETRISSSLAGILNASVPLFAAVLAFRLDPIGRIRGWRTAGLVAGFVGVAMAAGTDVSGSPAGVAAMVAASISYAIGAHYARARFSGIDPVGVALTQVLVSSALLVPLSAMFGRPDGMPSAEAIGSLAALGFGGTAIAFVLYYWLVSRAGPQQTVAVTYLVPVAAIVYGAVILDEHVPLLAIVGIAITIAGQAVVAAPGRAAPVPEAAGPAS